MKMMMDHEFLKAQHQIVLITVPLAIGVKLYVMLLNNNAMIVLLLANVTSTTTVHMVPTRPQLTLHMPPLYMLLLSVVYSFICTFCSLDLVTFELFGLLSTLGLLPCLLCKKTICNDWLCLAIVLKS